MKRACRCCSGQVTDRPILHYKNMPKAAQFFPTKDELAMEMGVELALYQCPKCGLIQLLDDPVPYYRDVIRTAGISGELREYREEFFRDFVETYGLKGKKVIEIGCGCGEFLSIMNTTGAIGCGLEHREESIAECRKKGLTVYQGFLEDGDTRLEGAPYDAFFIMNFLEHIPNPGEFLTGICRNLSEGAVGLVEVPNVDMVLKKMMFSEFISDHLMYFTKKSLGNLLELNGFEVLSCQSVWHDYVLSAVVRKREPIHLEPFQEQLLKIKREINQFMDLHTAHGQKVAAWGAGHQALAVLALTEVQEKIAFVVDSAPFKQDKYTPGTHIPIVSPEYLEQKQPEVSAVLIMAASYSDEVAGIVKKKYRDMAIGILRDDGIEVIE